jgi:adenylate cyclase
MSFITELKRRNVIRMAGLYLVGAWLVTQVAATLLPVFGAPTWVMKALVVLLSIGFFGALMFSWVFELTPQGLKRDAEVPASESIAPQTARRMERVFLVLLTLALGYFAIDKFVLAPKREAAIAARPQQVDATNAATKPVVASDQSIAVLPFVNMSSDKEQEYFSDGLSEELLNQLAQLPQLRVIARTSSFSFKGKEIDVATIAKALDVAHVLEGSVRKSGNTLRITAQLIRASDSSHLWSQTFDRDLTNVFQVQDEISREVVAALKLKLLPDQRIASTQRTSKTAAYEQYLIAKKVNNQVSGRSGLEASMAAFQRAIALDPDYANAWAQLATRQAGLADFAEVPDQRMAMIDTALASADHAIALAPDLPDGYLARSGIRFRMRWNWQGTHDDLALAKELDPNRAETFIGYAMVSFSLGLRDEGLAAARKAVALDPLEVGAWSSLGRLSEAAGEIAEAKRAWTRALAISPQHVWANFMFGNRLLKEGDIDGAITRYQRIAEPWSSVGMALGEFSRGNDGASRELLAKLEKDHTIGFAFQIAQVYAWRGEKKQAFEWLDRAYELHDAGMVRLPFDPAMDPLRSDPRFDALIRRLGFPQ